jgi:hypothetical protein
MCALIADEGEESSVMVVVIRGMHKPVMFGFVA